MPLALSRTRLVAEQRSPAPAKKRLPTRRDSGIALSAPAMREPMTMSAPVERRRAERRKRLGRIGAVGVEEGEQVAAAPRPSRSSAPRRSRGSRRGGSRARSGMPPTQLARCDRASRRRRRSPPDRRRPAAASCGAERQHALHDGADAVLLVEGGDDDGAAVRRVTRREARTEVDARLSAEITDRRGCSRRGIRATGRALRDLASPTSRTHARRHAADHRVRRARRRSPPRRRRRRRRGRCARRR